MLTALFSLRQALYVNSNIFKGQVSNENEAIGLSGEYGKQEAYTCSVSKEALIAQVK